MINLECLDYSNTYLELLELALCWSGYENCNIKFDLFSEFINSYFANTRLEWLEYNLKGALLIECSSKEEQQIGINEVKETMEYIVYYKK